MRRTIMLSAAIGMLTGLSLIALAQVAEQAPVVIVQPLKPDTVLDVTRWAEMALAIVGTVLTAVLGTIVTAAANALRLKTGINIDDDMRKRLVDGVVNAISYGGMVLIGKDGKVTVDVKSEKLKNALDYFQTKFPDTMKHFSLERGHIEDMITGQANKMALELASKAAPAADGTGTGHGFIPAAPSSKLGPPASV